MNCNVVTVNFIMKTMSRLYLIFSWKHYFNKFLIFGKLRLLNTERVYVYVSCRSVICTQEWVLPCFKLFGRLPFLGPHPCQQLLMVFPFHQRLQPEWFPTQSNHFLGQKFHVQNSELHNYPVQKNTTKI